MQTINKFIDTLVNIDLIGDTASYGHYPFQMISEDANGKLTVAALALGGNVMAVYHAAKRTLKEGAIKLFLSLDFPAGGDIKHDFVAVYSLINGELECIAIPYDPATGEQFERIASGSMLDKLKTQFHKLVLE